MRRECGVIAASMLGVQNQRHIQYGSLCWRVFAVQPKHMQNVLRSGEFRDRIVNEETGAVCAVVIVCLITVKCQLREHGDQLDTLAESVRQPDIVRIVVIRIQGKDAPRHGIHDVGARRFHNKIPDK